jgi:hypothetical protein
VSINSERLNPSEKAALAACLAKLGHRRASSSLGVAQMTLVKALRGEKMNRPVLTQIRTALALVTQIGGTR